MITTPNMGLKIWNLDTDPYSSAQLAQNFAIIENHDHSGNRGKQINGAAGIVDGSITSAKLANTVQTTPLDASVTTAKLVSQAVTKEKLDQGGVTTPLGLNDGTAVRRGKCIIATTETRPAPSYGLMPTPDQVQNIVLPTDGLIFVAYQATWQESTAGSARASIYIGGTQIHTARSLITTIQAAQMGSSNLPNWDRPLGTFGGGLISNYNISTALDYSGDVTTGQMVGIGVQTGDTIGYGVSSSGGDTFQVPVGGPCCIFASAGTYDVSIQYKVSSGTVTVKNRKLWVWTVGF